VIEVQTEVFDSDVFGTEIVGRLRDGDITIKDVKQELNHMDEGVETAVSKPNHEAMDVFTNKVAVDEDMEDVGNICINGEWVHPMYGKLANMLNNGKSPVIYVVGDPRIGKSNLWD